MKPQVMINNWFISGKGIVGEVTNHPVFADGECITTSRLIELDLKRNIAETKNTIYILGKPIKTSDSYGYRELDA